ncbi:MAG: glutathione-regulated potassium-efflux system protein KefC [Chromatiales bacterium]
MEEQGLLFNAFVYLLAAVVAVPLFKRLGLGSVLGYLVAGVVIGPWGVGLIVNVEDILHFAELGVVLLLFLVGLELDPKRLWTMRRPILGLGGLQVAVTGAVLALVGMGLGLPWRHALIAGMGLALSSTALVLQILRERNLLPTPAGNAGFSILLFQDIAVVPMLALMPLLAAGPATVGESGDWSAFAKLLGAVLLTVVGGRYLLRPVFRLVAGTRLPEIFTAFSLLLVIGIALMMDAVGMSMALGSFLAGVLLADSEYRHALESDIEPFKGLLLGLFFIAVGMTVDVGLLLERPLLVAALVAGLVGIKLALLWGLAGLFEPGGEQRPLFAVLLSQGGEFAFVLFNAAGSQGAMPEDLRALLIGVVALSMMTTPLLLLVHDRLTAPGIRRGPAREMDTIESRDNPVVIAGFGRFGQIVGRLLHANGIGTTILDHDPDQIELIRKFGFKVFYGDAARLDLLRAAGAERAQILVVAVDDRQQARRIVSLAREHFPNLRVLTRAWDLIHAFELRNLGVDDVQRETLESALRLAERALRRLGLTAWQSRQAANQFRAHDEQLFEELYLHFSEELEVRAAISADARERLREQMQADEVFFEQHRDDDWR